MNTKQRFKLGAGTGLVTMLLGALMVLAPIGAGAEVATDPPLQTEEGGNLLCSAIGDYSVSDKEDTVAEQTSGSVGGNGLEVSWTWDGTTVNFTVLTGSLPVGAVIVKTGSDDVANEPADSAADTGAHVTRYKTFSTAVAAGSSGFIGFAGNGLSNITFCAGEEEPDEPTLTVTKVIDSDETEALAATFPISVTKGEFEESDDLGHDESLPVIDPASGEYAISEDLPDDGWKTPTIECTGATPTGDEGGTWTVTVDDVDVACTITNTPESDTPPPPPPPPPPPVPFTYEVEVDKLNDADGDGTFSNVEESDGPGDAVEFQITIENTGTGPLVLVSLVDRVPGVGNIDLLAEDLDCEDDVDLAAGFELASGAVVTCTFVLEGYAPAAGSSLTNTVTVVTDRDRDSDTSVVEVDEVEVLPAPPVTPPAPPEETPPAVAPPVETPVVQPAAEVKGVQTVRTLPRTGDETRGLAGVGAFMLALGAAMVIGSRRQLARR